VALDKNTQTSPPRRVAKIKPIFGYFWKLLKRPSQTPFAGVSSGRFVPFGGSHEFLPRIYSFCQWRRPDDRTAGEFHHLLHGYRHLGHYGPIFKYSDTWQLVINTGTTIITFLMVFLIQNQQNRDGAAIQAKLDELLRAVEGARNDYVGIEHLTDTELEEILVETEKDACGDDDEDLEGRRKLQILRASFGRLRRHAPK
jgi:low affinity Fe/Cu permease